MHWTSFSSLSLALFCGTFVCPANEQVAFGQQTAQQQTAQRATVGNYPPNFETARREVYKTVGDVEIPLYIFEPEDAASSLPRPAIIFFFGGGWTSGTPKQFEQHCLHLAQRGMVAIAADYRVASRHQVKPVDCVRDGQAAIRWIRENAGRLHIDAEKIVAAGGSAGGHVAACTGLLDDLNPTEQGGTAIESDTASRPNALALFNPAVVLAAVEGQDDFFSNKGIANRLGVPAESLSPYHNISEHAPPTIIFHGTGDKTVPFWTVEKFTSKMKSLGNRCELKSFANQPHGFFNYGRGNGSNYLTTLRQLDEFLVSLEYLAKPARVNPLEQIDDTPGLPRVLLIGDSISMGYTLPVRQLLAGQANVHRPAENGGPTTNGLEKLKQWLGDGQWDLIHLNFGLHDLKFIGPEGQNLADPEDPANKRQVPLDEYEKNLRALVLQLQATGAKLIWRNTTPVPPGARGRVVGDAAKYNEVAAGIMKEQGIQIHDMYGYVRPRMSNIMLKTNVHFTRAGYEQLAGEVATVIRKALDTSDD